MVMPDDAAYAMWTPVVVAIPGPAMMPAVMTAHAAVKTAVTMTMPARTDVRGQTLVPDLRGAIRRLGRRDRWSRQAEEKTGSRKCDDFHWNSPC